MKSLSSIAHCRILIGVFLAHPGFALAGKADGWDAVKPYVLPPAGVKPLANFSHETTRFEEIYTLENHARAIEEIRKGGRPIAKGHPRIFITPETRDAIRQKFSVHFRREFQEIIRWADESFGKDTSVRPVRAYPPAGKAAMACGLVYQLGKMPGFAYKHSTEEYGSEGVRHLMNMIGRSKSAGVGDSHAYTLVAYLGLPCGYDWLYDVLTSEQRKKLADAMILDADPKTSSVQPMNYPPGHRVLAAAAILHDGFHDKDAQMWVDRFYQGETLCARPEHGVSTTSKENLSTACIIVPEGPGLEGLASGYSGRWFPFLPILSAWKSMTGEDYSRLSYIQNYGPFNAYALFGNRRGWEINYRQNNDGGTWEDREMAVSSAVMVTHEALLSHHNPEMASLASWLRLKERGGHDDIWIAYLLTVKGPVAAKSPAELKFPLSMHFRGSNHIFMHNAWNDPEATFACFLAPRWSGTRCVGAANNFVIFKHKGMAVMKRTGVRHEYAPFDRVNGIVCYDEAKPRTTITQINAGDSSSGFRDLPLGKVKYGSQYDLKGLLFFESSPGEFDYAMGDGTKSMIVPVLKNWTRQFIWFREEANDRTDHFVVFDRIEASKTGVSKHVMFNFNLEPRLVKEDQDAGQGRKLHDGVWQYESPDGVVATNDKVGAHNRTFLRTLLPKRATCYKMGGDREHLVDLWGKLQGLDAGRSTDMFPRAPEETRFLCGMWRVQIKETAEKPFTTFLHTIQVADSKRVQAPEPTRLVEGTGCVGAISGNKLALFSAREEPLKEARVTIPQGGKYRLLVADLPAGARVTITAGSRSIAATVSPQHIVYVKEIELGTGEILTIR